jgi:hypothetical protein
VSVHVGVPEHSSVHVGVVPVALHVTLHAVAPSQSASSGESFAVTLHDAPVVHVSVERSYSSSPSK